MITKFNFTQAPPSSQTGGGDGLKTLGYIVISAVLIYGGYRLYKYYQDQHEKRAPEDPQQPVAEGQ